MLPRMSALSWARILNGMRLHDTEKHVRLHRQLSPGAFRYLPSSLRGRVWKVLDLLAQRDAGTLDRYITRELVEKFAEVRPLADRLLASQDRWGHSRQ